MTVMHHPSAETLGAYAAGSLDTARRLVVASHLERCAACRRAVANFEAVGGALLEALPPTPMDEDALVRVLARLDAVPEQTTPRARPAIDMSGLPACLEPYALGRWRWIGPGLEMRPILLPQGEIGELIADRRLTFGLDAMEIGPGGGDEARYGAMVSLKDYPARSQPGMLDGILRLPFEMTLTESFAFVDRQVTLDRMGRALRRLRAAGSSAKMRA